MKFLYSMTLTNKDLLKGFFPPSYSEVGQTQFSFRQKLNTRKKPQTLTVFCAIYFPWNQDPASFVTPPGDLQMTT